jgi:hypothetical protein
VVTRRSALEWGLGAIAVAGIALSVRYYSAYRSERSHAHQLLVVENARCNAARAELESARRAQREGRNQLAAMTLSAIERDLPLCARSRESYKAANGDLEKLLDAVPERNADDTTILERLDD